MEGGTAAGPTRRHRRRGRRKGGNPTSLPTGAQPAGRRPAPAPKTPPRGRAARQSSPGLCDEELRQSRKFEPPRNLSMPKVAVHYSCRRTWAGHSATTRQDPSNSGVRSTRTWPRRGELTLTGWGAPHRRVHGRLSGQESLTHSDGNHPFLASCGLKNQVSHNRRNPPRVRRLAQSGRLKTDKSPKLQKTVSTA